MQTTAHARHSPSGMAREMTCPGSLKMQEGRPDEHNKNSDMGTACHAVAATCLTEGGKPSEFIEREIFVHDVFDSTEEPRSVTFTDELADLCTVYVENIRAMSAGRILFVEQKVEFTDFVRDSELEELVEEEHTLEAQFGTADAVILAQLEDATFELQVHDAKFGFRWVDVERNKQLLTYALACLRRFELLYDITHVRIFIHQPRIYSEPTEWACTVEELLAFGETELKPAIQKAEEANRMHVVLPIAEWQSLYLNPTPNENDCAYCKAMAVCPAYAIAVATTLSLCAKPSDFPFDTKAIPIGPSNFVIASPEAFTHAQDLTLLMSKIDDIETFITAVRAEMERRLLGGLNSQDLIDTFQYKLVEGRQGPRKWVEPEVAEKYLREVARLRIDQAFNLKLKSPTQVEDQLVKGPKGEKPALSAKQWSRMQENIARSKAKLSVAPASDKRPAAQIKPLAAGDFPLDTLAEIKQTAGVRFG
jgi:hypothetical protein